MLPPDDRMSALEIRRPAEGRRLPLIVHVPYAARALPPSARARLALSEAARRERLPEITDDLLDRVFALAAHLGATLVVNRVSRLALDTWDTGAGRTGAAAPDVGPLRIPTGWRRCGAKSGWPRICVGANPKRPPRRRRLRPGATVSAGGCAWRVSKWTATAISIPWTAAACTAGARARIWSAICRPGPPIWCTNVAAAAAGRC